MASLAPESGANAKASRPPISTHPAFPVIVALWFAALLGLGSLVVPVALVEKAVTVTGLSSIIGATAPPLGFTARALIALACTVLGAVTGLLIARQVAKAHAPAAAGRFALGRSAAASRTPINAHEELGALGFDHTAVETGNRRRALALEAEDGPSEFFNLAPLPGVTADDEAEILMADAEDYLVEDVLAEEGQTDPDDPLELMELELSPADLPEAELPEAEDEQTIEDHHMTSRQEFIDPAQSAEQPSPDQPAQEPYTMDFRTAAARRAHAQDDSVPEETAANIDSTDIDSAWVDPETDVESEADADTDSGDGLSFSPPSMMRAEAEEADMQVFGASEIPEAESEEMTMDQAAAAEASHVPESGQEADHAPDQQWSDAPLEELGLVQLAQRLGSSISKNRELRAARAALASSLASSAPVPPRALAGAFAEDDLDMAEAGDAAEAMQAYFGKSKEAAEAESAPVDIAGEAQQDEREEAAPFASFRQPAEDAQADEPVEAEDAEMQVFQVPEPAPPPFPHFVKISLVEDEDEDELDEIAASFSLPLGQISAKTSTAAETQAAPEASAEPVTPPQPETPAEPETPAAPEPTAASADDAEGFASLLKMGNPFKANAEEFVRIEDEPEAAEGHIEPAVVFPADAETKEQAEPQAEQQAETRADFARPFDPPDDNGVIRPVAKPRPVNSEENERALREALLNLQRMSGAA